MNTPATARSAVNLRIRADLKQEAKSLGVNLSRTLEQSLEAEIRRRKQADWRAANSAAIKSYNKRIDQHGPALAEFRRF